VTTVEIIPARDVPLGGPRALTVRRTLPSRQRTLIGAWCFVDHFGPDPIETGMSFAPHPHTGLQTVSWLFTGEVEHRDSAGNHAIVRPGELNLMTAGRGISHSEVSRPDSPVLHGAQLWVALPEHARHADPGFDHYAPAPIAGPGWTARVFTGSALGDTAPVLSHTPLLGVELLLEPGGGLDIPVDSEFEHGFLVDAGQVAVNDVRIPVADLAYVPPGTEVISVTAYDVPARLLMLGGPPFGEQILMWWNFIGRSHEEIVRYRTEWHEQIVRDGDLVTGGQDVVEGRFGVVTGEWRAPIPAPTLPNSRLLPRT
jgi:quercetin 2,3-dioxygenase